MTFHFDPIGFVRSPFEERVQAPRQGTVVREVEGRIELFPGKGYDHALEGLGDWEYVWVIFVFHRNVEQSRGWKAKVQPPRATRKQGVFATRSPHRPNPIGLTAARIVRVEGLVVHVLGLDLLDGTPVLDLKPYVAYADAFPAAGSGWLEARDPLPPWRVHFEERAQAQLEWLEQRGVALRAPIEAALTLGPAPLPYRRIRARGDELELAVKEWRVDFAAGEGRSLVVRSIRSGRKVRGGALPDGLPVHRDFTEVFRGPGT